MKLGLCRWPELQSAEMDEADCGRPSRQWVQRSRVKKAQPRVCSEEGEVDPVWLEQARGAVSMRAQRAWLPATEFALYPEGNGVSLAGVKDNDMARLGF